MWFARYSRYSGRAKRKCVKMQNKSPQANAQSDEDLKNAGNRFFSSKKFEEAIQCYSKAIVSILICSISIVFQFRPPDPEAIHLEINISFITPTKNSSVLHSMTSWKSLHDVANNDLLENSSAGQLFIDFRWRFSCNLLFTLQTTIISLHIVSKV